MSFLSSSRKLNLAWVPLILKGLTQRHFPRCSQSVIQSVCQSDGNFKRPPCSKSFAASKNPKSHPFEQWVLVGVTVAVLKHQDQSNLWRKRRAASSSWLSWPVAYGSHDHQPAMAAAIRITSKVVPLLSITNEESAVMKKDSQVLWRRHLSWGSLLSEDSSLYGFDIKLASTLIDA